MRERVSTARAEATTGASNNDGRVSSRTCRTMPRITPSRADISSRPFIVERQHGATKESLVCYPAPLGARCTPPVSSGAPLRGTAAPLVSKDQPRASIVTVRGQWPHRGAVTRVVGYRRAEPVVSSIADRRAVTLDWMRYTGPE